MSLQRQVDLHGSISACDAAGRTLHVHCAGPELRIDTDSVRAALSAFSAMRASGVVDILEPPALDRLNNFRIELCVRGQRVGRAGAGAHASRLARALTRMPLELNLLALLRAGLKAFLGTEDRRRPARFSRLLRPYAPTSEFARAGTEGHWLLVTHSNNQSPLDRPEIGCLRIGISNHLPVPRLFA